MSESLIVHLRGEEPEPLTYLAAEVRSCLQEAEAFEMAADVFRTAAAADDIEPTVVSVVKAEAAALEVKVASARRRAEAHRDRVDQRQREIAEYRDAEPLASTVQGVRALVEQLGGTVLNHDTWTVTVGLADSPPQVELDTSSVTARLQAETAQADRARLVQRGLRNIMRNLATDPLVASVEWGHDDGSQPQGGPPADGKVPRLAGEATSEAPGAQGG